MREVLAQRVLWCVPAAVIAVFAMLGWRNGWSEIAKALNLRMLATLAASAVFIFMNWGLYVWLVMTQRVIESSLAYFLAPLVAVAVGVLVYKERITGAQTAALALAACRHHRAGLRARRAAVDGAGALRDVVGLHRHPQSRAGAGCGWTAIESLCWRQLRWRSCGGAHKSRRFRSDRAPRTRFCSRSQARPPRIPLTAFAFGARRVSFTTLGLLQFLAPTLQFATGIAFGEPFTPLRAASFALIWIGLAFFSWDTIRRARMSMIYYAIGDVHGEKAKLDDLLRRICEDAASAAAHDRVSRRSD